MLREAANSDPPITAPNTSRPPTTPPAIAPAVAPLALALPVLAPALEAVLPPAEADDEKTGLLTAAPVNPAATNEALTAAMVEELLRLEVRVEAVAVALPAL